MTQYRDDKNGRIVDKTTGEPLGSLPPYEAEDDMIAARERRGFSPWGVVGAGIAVILIAAASFAIWPTATTEPTSTASTKTDPINAQPSGQGTFDNNPATGSIKPPEAVDKNANPSGNGGGATQVTTPSGAEKTQ